MTDAERVILEELQAEIDAAVARATQRLIAARLAGNRPKPTASRTGRRGT